MSDPLVLALLGDAGCGAALAAGFEEEGVPVTVTVVAARADPADAAVQADPAAQADETPEALAREASRRAVLGIGIGGDGERLVVVLAGGSPVPYLEAPAAAARSLGRNAARIASRRPLTLG